MPRCTEPVEANNRYGRKACGQPAAHWYVTDQFGSIVAHCKEHHYCRDKLHSSYHEVTEDDAAVFEIMHR